MLLCNPSSIIDLSNIIVAMQLINQLSIYPLLVPGKGIFPQRPGQIVQTEHLHPQQPLGRQCRAD